MFLKYVSAKVNKESCSKMKESPFLFFLSASGFFNNFAAVKSNKEYGQKKSQNIS